MPPALEERKVVSVLFSDLVDSTDRADRRDPEDVRATLVPFYRLLREELERFGGTVEKFIGDAVMALFGAPVAHEDDAERRSGSALGIRRAIERLNEERGLDLRVRTGVATGEALIALEARPGEGLNSTQIDTPTRTDVDASRLRSLVRLDANRVLGTHTPAPAYGCVGSTPVGPVDPRCRGRPRTSS